MAPRIQTVVVKDILIEPVNSRDGTMLFRATNNKLYNSWDANAQPGETLKYIDDDDDWIGEIPPDVWDVDPVLNLPNIIGGKYFEVGIPVKSLDGSRWDENSLYGARVSLGDNTWSDPWDGYGVYDPKAKSLSIQAVTGWTKYTDGVNAGWQYKDEWGILTYSGVNLLATEVKHRIDFNDDGVVGDRIKKNYGAGLYSTMSGGLYWSDSEESEGSPISSKAKLISSDAKILSNLETGVAFLHSMGASLAQRWREGSYSIEIALPIFKENKGKLPTFDSLSIYEINTYITSNPTGDLWIRTAKESKDIYKYERLFERDFNVDGFIGDAVIQKFGAGLFATTSNSLYWSKGEEKIGSAASSEAKLLSSDHKVLLPIKEASEALKVTGGSLASRPIALNSDKLLDDLQVAVPIFKTVTNSSGLPKFSSLNLYDINTGTGKFKITAISKLTEILSYEMVFKADLNLDSVIGDGVNLHMGEGLYSTGSGSLYWSHAQETLGSVPSADAILLSADPKVLAPIKAAYDLLQITGGSLASRRIALDKDKIDNDVQIAIPIYKGAKDPNQLPSFATLSLYDINTTTGKYKTSTVSKLPDVLKSEILFEKDFNGDSIIGDGIALDFGAGLYSTGTESLLWSPVQETIGSSPSADAKLLSVDPKVLAPIKAAFTLLQTTGGSLASRTVALDKDKLEDDVQIALPVFKSGKRPNDLPSLASLNLYDINSSTGKYKTTTVSRLPEILKYEALFQSDLNADDFIGDAITGSYGAGLYSTVSGSLYWSPVEESVGYTLGTSAKLISADAKVLTPFKQAYDRLTDLGGYLETRQIALDKDGIEDDAQIAFPIFKAKGDSLVFTSLNIYNINGATGKYTLTSVTKATEILKYEENFWVDFNGDSMVGSPI